MSKPGDASTPDPVEEDPVGRMFAAGLATFGLVLAAAINVWFALDGIGGRIDLVSALVLVILAGFAVRQFIRARRIAKGQPPTPRFW
jgi:hypothetical protein